MNYSPELNRKLELYAGGWLEGRELHDFEQLLEKDAELRNEAIFRKSVVEAIREFRQHELKSYIKQNAKVHLASNQWGKVWTIASIIIIGVAAAFFFIDFNNLLPEQKQETEKPKPVIVPPVAVQQEIADSVITDSDTLSTPVAENKTETKQDFSKPEDTSLITTEVAKNPDSALIDQDGEEEIIVKRDELLATINLKAIDKSPVKQPPQENISSSTIEKLNPEAKLPEPPPQQETFRVELWKSPINFKGYRLVKNRLTLFGVEQNVILRLYKINDTFYLEYEPNSFTRLYPGDQFNAFVKIRDPEILSQLMQ